MNGLRKYRPVLAAAAAALMMLATATNADAQQRLSRREQRKAEREERVQAAAAEQVRKQYKDEHAAHQGKLMPFFVDERGDTVYYDSVPPVWCFGKDKRMKKSDWKKYYRLVYNFNKVYPYVAVGSSICHEVDSTIEARHMNRMQKEKYIRGWEKQLLTDFEPIVREMTVSQGKLLCRLVDREIGKDTYSILKGYTNSLTAGFYQGLGKLFGQDLKSHYDPDGVDKQTEELIQMWENGEFDFLYYSIFMVMPVRTEVPSKYQ
jgi:hypothetical protein